MASTTFAGQLLQRETWNILQYFPLLSSPALQSDAYAVNDTLIMTRAISGIAFSYIAMAALYWACPAVTLLVAKYKTLAVLGSSVLSSVPGMIELWRACSAADWRAAEEYKNQTPSDKATDRLCSSPRAFQYLLDRNENLSKLDSQGTSLASKILSSWKGFSKVARMLVDADIPLLTADAEGVNLFMRAVGNSNSATLRHILKSKKVQAANIHEWNQVAIWKHVQNVDVMELLCQYGFNIDAQDMEGNTPLMYWAQRERHFPLSVAALNAKANPLLQNYQGVKASQRVLANSLLQSLLLQAEREFEKEPIPSPQEKGFMAWLPWRPLVCKDNYSYTVDSNAFMTRVYVVGIAAIALIFFTPSSMIGMVGKIFIGVTVVSIPLFITELWRSYKEAQRQAVAEYLASSIPSKQSTTTICTSVAAARLLVESSSRPECLNKLDEGGGHLLGKYKVDPEVFKLFVDNNADIFAGMWHSGFSRAVEDSRPDLLAYILDRRRINIQEMSVELQMKMWSSIGSEQTARFLKQYGFDPDVQDAEGNTALMYLARQGNILGKIPLAKIQILLAVGANPFLVNQGGQTARNLAADSRIADLL